MRAIRHCPDLDLFRIEAAGDVVSKTLSKLAANKDRDGVRFSSEGLTEIRSIHDKVIANISLAGNVLVSGDVGIARQLLEEKNKFTLHQRKSGKSHLKRLAKGRLEVLESSDLNLETGLAFLRIQKPHRFNRLSNLGT